MNLNGQEDVDATKKLISVTDTVVVRRTNVDDLKIRHTEILNHIDSLKVEANTLVDELTAINDSALEVTVSGIPSKL